MTQPFKRPGSATERTTLSKSAPYFRRVPLNSLQLTELSRHAHSELSICERHLLVRHEHFRGSRKGSDDGELFGKWGLVFRFQDGEAHEVELADYQSTQERTMDPHVVNGPVPAEQLDNLLDQLRWSPPHPGRIVRNQCLGDWMTVHEAVRKLGIESCELEEVLAGEPDVSPDLVAKLEKAGVVEGRSVDWLAGGLRSRAGWSEPRNANIHWSTEPGPCMKPPIGWQQEESRWVWRPPSSQAVDQDGAAGSSTYPERTRVSAQQSDLTRLSGLARLFRAASCLGSQIGPDMHQQNPV